MISHICQWCECLQLWTEVSSNTEPPRVNKNKTKKQKCKCPKVWGHLKAFRFIFMYLFHSFHIVKQLLNSTIYTTICTVKLNNIPPMFFWDQNVSSGLQCSSRTTTFLQDHSLPQDLQHSSSTAVFLQQCLSRTLVQHKDQNGNNTRGPLKFV